MLNFFDDLADDLPETTAEEDARLQANAAQLVMAGYESFVEPGEAVGFAPDYFDGLQELAARYYAGQRNAEAADLFRRLIQLKPMNPEYLKGLGACLLAQQAYDQALQVYSGAQSYDALDPEIYYYMGQAQYFLKQYEHAFDALRVARVMAEDDPRRGGQIAAWATQLLERIKPLVPPEQAALIDKRP